MPPVLFTAAVAVVLAELLDHAGYSRRVSAIPFLLAAAHFMTVNARIQASMPPPRPLSWRAGLVVLSCSVLGVGAILLAANLCAPGGPCRNDPWWWVLVGIGMVAIGTNLGVEAKRYSKSK